MLTKTRRSLLLAAAALTFAFSAAAAQADKVLLNVSYDPTREFYKEFNEAFAADWKAKTGEAITINQCRMAAPASRRAW